MNTRYGAANAAYKIDGYILGQATEKSFNAAKDELLGHIAKECETIRGITLERFLAEKKSGFK